MRDFLTVSICRQYLAMLDVFKPCTYIKFSHHRVLSFFFKYVVSFQNILKYKYHGNITYALNFPGFCFALIDSEKIFINLDFLGWLFVAIVIIAKTRPQRFYAWMNQLNQITHQLSAWLGSGGPSPLLLRLLFSR